MLSLIYPFLHQWQLSTKIRLLVGSLCLMALGSCGLLHSPEGQTEPEILARFWVQRPTGVQFQKDGQPYPIKGACIVDDFYDLDQYGGNSVRLYTPTGLDSLLDQAQARGLTVMVGLDMAPIRNGFDYYDPQKVQAQEAAILDTVRKYRTHPALLMWNLGNEINLVLRDKIVWQAVESLARQIKAIDPDHPTTISVHADESMIQQVAAFCPSLDILSLNLFAVLERMLGRLEAGQLGWTGPYIITEWGNKGYWESGVTHWDVPVEPGSFDKVAQLRFTVDSILERAPHCIGHYVFLWGHKQERTQSWFSFFDQNGYKTPLVDEIQFQWTGQYPADRAPIIEALSLNNQTNRTNLYLSAASNFEAEVFVSEPEGQALEISWEVLPEGRYRTIFGGDREKRPAPVDGAIQSADSMRMTGVVPSALGPYRLFVYARDPQGAVSIDNFPFFVTTP